MGTLYEITAELLQMITDIKFDSIHASAKEGIKKILNDEAVAMIYVAGKPTKLLSSMPKKVPFHLLSFRNNDIGKVYKKSVIPVYTYPFQNTKVKTYAVKSILATYNYTKNQASYKRVKKLAKCINDKLEYLKSNGHSKWKEVDLKNIYDVKWPIHESVQEYLNEKQVTQGIMNILDGI